jgi:hypothetical protein
MREHLARWGRPVTRWWAARWDVPPERRCAYRACPRRNRPGRSAVLPLDDGNLTYRFCSKRHMAAWHDENFG